jgi:hypothetical protein
MSRRTAFYCWLLFSVWAYLAVMLGRSNLASGKLLDFTSFWAAGRLANAETPSLAWNIHAHEAAMATALGVVNGIMPFPYPPPMLLLIMPFALAPYTLAFVLWVGTTFAFYLWQSRRLAPTALAAAQPAVLINLLIGQNGFLTAGILLGGTSRLSERPFVAGLILGLLIIKPQLAVMLPIAVIAGGHWRAAAGAAVTAAALAAVSWLLFGPASFSGFVDLLPVYAQWMAEGRFDLSEFASPFALLRLLGLGQSSALIGQILVAAAATAACWHAWSKDMPGKVAVLCAASLLASPYLQAYDSLLLLAPIAFLAERRPALAATLFGLTLLTVGTQAGLWTLPDLTPIAAILALWWCGQRVERSAEAR